MSSPTNHALLSASSAHRWLSAPPLPRLEQFFPHPTSNAAAEGTAAHALGEYKVHRALGHSFKHSTSNYQSNEMESYTDDYYSYVLEQFKAANQHQDCDDLTQQIMDLRKQKEKVQSQETEHQVKLYNLDEINQLVDLHKYGLVDFDEQLVRRLIEKITIFQRYLEFTLKDGEVIRVNM